LEGKWLTNLANISWLKAFGTISENDGNGSCDIMVVEKIL